MTSIVNLQRVTVGLLYFNDFTATDDTTKSSDNITWSLAGGTYLQASGNGVAVAYKSCGVEAYIVYAYAKADSPEFGAGARITAYDNLYYTPINSANRHYLLKQVGGVLVNLGDAVHAYSAAVMYLSKLKVQQVATRLEGVMSRPGVTRTRLTSNDVAFTSGQNGGVRVGILAGTVQIDWIGITGITITMTGLLDAQRFKIYSSGNLVGTSDASVGGTAVWTVTMDDDYGPKFDKIEITDTDGSTIVYSSTSWTDICGGDIFQAQVTQTPLKNPPRIQPPNVAGSHVYLRTKRHAYTTAISASASPPAANKLGAFRWIIPDVPSDDKGSSKQTLERQFTFEPWPRVWIGGKAGGRRDLILTGIIERTTPTRVGGQAVLEVAGRSCGAYADNRKATTTITFGPAEISTIVKQLAAYVPELEVSNYVYATGKTYTLTWLRGRSVWDAWLELAAAATTPQVPWGVWDCRGEHLGETGPGIHFGPVTRGASLVPIVRGNFSRLIAPKDSKQILTEVIIAYTSAGVVNYYVADAVGPGENSRYALTLDGATNYVTVADPNDLLSFSN